MKKQMYACSRVKYIKMIPFASKCFEGRLNVDSYITVPRKVKAIKREKA